MQLLRKIPCSSIPRNRPTIRHHSMTRIASVPSNSAALLYTTPGDIPGDVLQLTEVPVAACGPTDIVVQFLLVCNAYIIRSGLEIHASTHIPNRVRTDMFGTSFLMANFCLHVRRRFVAAIQAVHNLQTHSCSHAYILEVPDCTMCKVSLHSVEHPQLLQTDHKI